jgi:hypothetical protein
LFKYSSCILVVNLLESILQDFKKEKIKEDKRHTKKKMKKSKKYLGRDENWY